MTLRIEAVVTEMLNTTVLSIRDTDMQKMNRCIVRSGLILTIAGSLAAILLATPDSANGQEWLNHEYVQPLPQYRSPNAGLNRYPLQNGPAKATRPNQQTVPQNTLKLPLEKLPLEELPKPLSKPPPKPLPPSAGNESVSRDGRVQLSINPLSGEPQSDAFPNSPIVKQDTPTGPLSSTRPPSSVLTPNPPTPPARGLRPPSASTSASASNSNEESRTRPDRVAAKPKTNSHNIPEINYDIYRDLSVYPLDPRKQNNPCTQGPSCGCDRCGRSGQRKMGFQGRPYQPQEPGGYSCGRKCPSKRPQFSMFWPRPFSAKLDEAFPQAASRRYEPGQKKKVWDVFDKLTNFTVIDYQRTDNGYSGPGCDPYGCLGESKVFGVGFRLPGDSVNSNPLPYPLGR